MLVRVTSGYFLQDLIQLNCPSNRNLVFLLRNYSEYILPEVILEWEYHTNVSGNY